MTTGDRIKYLRKDVFDLTQEQFAIRIGIKRNTVATYESGRNEPVDSVKSLICREFNVRREWLETGEEPMFKPEPSSPLGDLINVYNLDDFDQSLVMEYLKLSAEHRHVFKDYLQRVLDQSDAVDEPEDEEDLEAFIASIPDTPEELEKMYPTFDAPPDVNKMG